MVFLLKKKNIFHVLRIWRSFLGIKDFIYVCIYIPLIEYIYIYMILKQKGYLEIDFYCMFGDFYFMF